MVAAVQSDVSTEVNRKWPVITNVPQWTHFPIFSFLYVDASSQQRWVFFCVSQILVQSPGTVVDPGFPESKFRPVVLVRKSSFLHIVQLSLTVTVKSVWISLHKHQLSGTKEKKTPAVLCGSLSQKQSPLSELKPPHGVRGQSARSLQRNALQEAATIILDISVQHGVKRKRLSQVTVFMTEEKL